MIKQIDEPGVSFFYNVVLSELASIISLIFSSSSVNCSAVIFFTQTRYVVYLVIPKLNKEALHGFRTNRSSAYHHFHQRTVAAKTKNEIRTENKKK